MTCGLMVNTDFRFDPMGCSTRDHALPSTFARLAFVRVFVVPSDMMGHDERARDRQADP